MVHSRMVKSGFTFEYLMWTFMRVSGLSIIFLGLFGLTMAFVLGARTQVDMGALLRWTFFPNPNHVVNTDIANLDAWSNGFWQVMQILIIFFGATHGFNGLRMVLEDFTGPSFLKTFLRGLVFLLWMFVLIIALYVILSS